MAQITKKVASSLSGILPLTSKSNEALVNVFGIMNGAANNANSMMVCTIDPPKSNDEK